MRISMMGCHWSCCSPPGVPKDIQGLMRHSRLATTMEIYMQSLEKEVRTAINSIHDELVATGTDGPSPQPSSQTQQDNTTEGVDSKVEAPSHGKILPFAGKHFAWVPLSC